MNLKSILDFLSLLKKNNNRDWFHANKSDYQKARKEFELFIETTIAGISSFDKEIGIMAAKDCIFRINRDVRFSKNKDPYKTNFGALIARGGKKSQYAGYYIHIEPDASFIGGGSYMPESKNLKAIRTEIYYHPKEFKEIIHNDSFRNYFKEIFGEKLKTAPRYFPKDFEDIELLKPKHYAVAHSISDAFWQNGSPMEKTLNIFKELYPLNRFLNDVIQNSTKHE